MKFRLLLSAALFAAVVASFGQGKSSERKTMVFQPGAKTPDSPAATPAPKAVPAQPAAAGAADPTQAAAAFFGLLQRGAIDDAYASLTKGSKIGESPEELRNLKAKTVEAIEVFGAIQGYEVLETKKVGANLLRRTYLSLGKEFPLRWRFYYYQSGGVWKLVDLRVDDRLSGMFEEPEESKMPEQKP